MYHLHYFNHSEEWCPSLDTVLHQTFTTGYCRRTSPLCSATVYLASPSDMISWYYFIQHYQSFLNNMWAGVEKKSNIYHWWLLLEFFYCFSLITQISLPWRSNRSPGRSQCSSLLLSISVHNSLAAKVPCQLSALSSVCDSRTPFCNVTNGRQDGIFALATQEASRHGCQLLLSVEKSPPTAC